jgi:N4-gp56 family major capsid protein
MTVATTYGDISQRTAVWAEIKMLEHAEPILVLDKFGDVKPLPKNTANTITFRRPVPYTVTTTQLVEGVTPAPKGITYQDVTVVMGQYGDLFELSDIVADMSEDPVLANASMLLGEQAAETKELILWGVLRAGTSVFLSGTGTPTLRAHVNDTITLNLQRAVTRSLKQQRAKTITSMISASPKFGTEAVAPAFVAFGHTDLEQDIRDMDGFTPVERYGNFSPISPYEIGKVEGVRYILSPVLVPFANAGSATLNGMVSTGGVNVDVYPVIFIGKNAYGTVPLKGAGSMNPVVINPGTPTKDDPLGQRGYVGWKMYFAATILNNAWMSRVEVGVTDLA